VPWTRWIWAFCAACVEQVSALTGHKYQECLKGLIGRVSCCSSPLPYVRAIRSFPPAGGEVWRANGEHAFIAMLRGEAAADEGKAERDAHHHEQESLGTLGR
jgi:hypothetical protein